VSSEKEKITSSKAPSKLPTSYIGTFYGDDLEYDKEIALMLQTSEDDTQNNLDRRIEESEA